MAAPAPPGIEDLGQIIQAYNRVTENLQKSHESLQNQVIRLRSQLASADAQLQRSKRLAALGQMAAGIAHEIRNPLAAVQLYASMLVEDLDIVPDQSARNDAGAAFNTGAKPGAGNLRIAQKIAFAVHGLNAIVTDVLSFAREIKPHKTFVKVNDLFERAVEAHRPAIDAAGVAVRFDGLPDSLIAYADADLIGQVLLNLVRNAVDALTRDPESMDYKVTTAASAALELYSQKRGDSVVLTIRDTGPGIAAENIDRIFNPFFTTRHSGTGLGLAIVHRIVDAHGGSIAVRNECGAVFELSLPEADRDTNGPRRERNCQ